MDKNASQKRDASFGVQCNLCRISVRRFGLQCSNIHAQVEKCHETYAVLIAARQQLASNVKRMAMMPMKAFSLRMKQVTQQVCKLPGL